MHAYIHIHIHTYSWISYYIYTYTYTHIHTHTHTCKYIHTHKHAHTQCTVTVVMAGFAINAMLIATGESGTLEWYLAAIRTCFFLMPFAQFLPSCFRLVSKDHSSFNVRENVQVYEAEETVARPLFGPNGLERKTRLRTLRKRFGSAAIRGESAVIYITVFVIFVKGSCLLSRCTTRIHSPAHIHTRRFALFRAVTMLE